MKRFYCSHCCLLYDRKQLCRFCLAPADIEIDIILHHQPKKT
ncbi:hypothetical protein [Rossellomorea marisflavi]